MRRSTVVLGSTIGIVVLYVAAVIALGTVPEASDHGAAVASWFRDNGDHVRIWAWLITLVLLDVASYWGPVLIGTSIAILAPLAILGWQRRAGLPRWLGVIAGVALLEQLVETITIFGGRGFIAPGGPMNLYLGGLVFMIAFVGFGVALSRAVAD